MSNDAVLIVGAGMAGLTAATELKRRGIESVLVDKGRAPGGRMATRTIGEGRFDHGAQHFSVRAPAFAEAVAAWTAAGVVHPWFESASLTNPALGTEPRHVGTGGMRRVPEHLAADLDVRTGVRIITVDVDDDGVVLRSEDDEFRGGALILTPPLPQLLELLDTGRLALANDVRADLEAVRYEQCLAVMATLDGPSGLVDGHISGSAEEAGEADPVVAWIGDNQHKGTSTAPTVTVHSTPEFAAERADDIEAEGWVGALCDAARPRLASSVVDAIGHRWALSRPTSAFDTGSLVVDASVPVVLAGEVFAGARVEGAFLSGLAAAETTASRLGAPPPD